MRSKIDFTKVGQHIKTARTEAKKNAEGSRSCLWL